MITYAASDEGAFALNNATPGAVKQAAIKGYQLLLRSVLSYESIYRSAGNEQAFEQSTKYIVKNMMDSIYKKLEVELLYGQAGIATVGSVTSTTNVTLLASDFAPGIWAGSRNMPIDVYTSAGVLRGSTSVLRCDLSTKILQLNTAVAAIAATDVIYPSGAFGKQMKGMYQIMSNTGVMFGIDAANYEMWEGTQYTLASPGVLSFSVIQQAIVKGVEKGLDKDCVVLCNPGHWDNLLTEQAALRMFDSSFKSDVTEVGSKAISFFSQNGQVKIIPSIYVKEGHAFIICPEDWARVGSTDVTFNRPGQPNNFFRELEGYAGVEMRCYVDNAAFCLAPGRQVLIKNLTV